MRTRLARGNKCSWLLDSCKKALLLSFFSFANFSTAWQRASCRCRGLKLFHGSIVYVLSDKRTILTQPFLAGWRQVSLLSRRHCAEADVDSGEDAKGDHDRSRIVKRLILIRHGCTYMNEFLAQPGCEWGDPTFRDDWSFRDSSLSPRGVRQAKRLGRRICNATVAADIDAQYQALPLIDEEMRTQNELSSLWREVDLVVVSPLSRALQTFELGLLPHIPNEKIPVVALPLAAERLYLSSDVGTPAVDLQRNYPFVDFVSEFEGVDPLSQWWYSHDKDGGMRSDGSEPSVANADNADSLSYAANTGATDYVEWRPHGQGQTYVCLGEPEQAFQRRMANLREWLMRRNERTIALVCHRGVLQWLCGREFENCEVKVVNSTDLRADDYGFEL